MSYERAEIQVTLETEGTHKDYLSPKVESKIVKGGNFVTGSDFQQIIEGFEGRHIAYPLDKDTKPAACCVLECMSKGCLYFLSGAISRDKRKR